ncbi:MAG: hypothetical protein HN427_03840 [Flavobacteriales bacterium]|jgi:septation ring formation regulator EzrA|nr:hypothetical protein [Flavobacteriales bacterium]
MSIVFGILLILIAFFVFGGYTRHKSGEINVLIYDNDGLIVLICLVLLISGLYFIFS